MKTTRREFMTTLFRKNVDSFSDQPLAQEWIPIGHYRDFQMGEDVPVNAGKQRVKSSAWGLRAQESVGNEIITRPLRLDGHTGAVYINVKQVWPVGAYLSHTAGEMRLREE